jgi:hypothetical protein
MKTVKNAANAIDALESGAVEVRCVKFVQICKGTRTLRKVLVCTTIPQIKNFYAPRGKVFVPSARKIKKQPTFVEPMPRTEEAAKLNWKRATTSPTAIESSVAEAKRMIGRVKYAQQAR